MPPTIEAGQTTEKITQSILTPQQLVEKCKINFDANSLKTEENLKQLHTHVRQTDKLINRFLVNTVNEIKKVIIIELENIYNPNKIRGMRLALEIFTPNDLKTIIPDLDIVGNAIRLLKVLLTSTSNESIGAEELKTKILEFNTLMSSVEHNSNITFEKLPNVVNDLITQITSSYRSQHPIDNSKICDVIKTKLNHLGITETIVEAKYNDLKIEQETIPNTALRKFIESLKIYKQVKPCEASETQLLINVDLRANLKTLQEFYKYTQSSSGNLVINYLRKSFISKRFLAHNNENSIWSQIIENTIFPELIQLANDGIDFGYNNYANRTIKNFNSNIELFYHLYNCRLEFIIREVNDNYLNSVDPRLINHDEINTLIIQGFYAAKATEVNLVDQLREQYLPV